MSMILFIPPNQRQQTHTTTNQQLFIKYPREYVEAFLSGSYGYWYPETVYWQVSSYSYYRSANQYTSHDKNISQCKPPRLEELRNIISSCINYHFRNIPVISMFLSIALYFWISY